MKNQSLFLTFAALAALAVTARAQSLDPQAWRPTAVDTSSDRNRAVLEDESIHSCRNAFADRILSDGYSHVQFGDASKDVHPRTDWVSGTATADRRYATNDFSFSCHVEPTNGEVRRLDITRR